MGVERTDAAVQAALAEPFDPAEVKWKAQTVKGNRAMAVAYIDARLVEDRLDEVLGVGGWRDEYEVLAEGSVVCRLSLRLEDGWLTKWDVGSPSEQPDAGDRLKSAFSDALKRAAVKFGVGRYLYRLPTVWADYDPQKRQIAQTPRLPDDALPARLRKNRPAALAAPRPAALPAPDAPPPPPSPVFCGKSLETNIANYEATLVEAGKCRPGDLLAVVRAALDEAGIDPEHPGSWPPSARQVATDATVTFKKSLEKK